MREKYVCVCMCVRVLVFLCVSFSLLGSYAKFVPDFVFVFLCVFSKSPKKLNLPGIFYLVLQPKSI